MDELASKCFKSGNQCRDTLIEAGALPEDWIDPSEDISISPHELRFVGSSMINKKNLDDNDAYDELQKHYQYAGKLFNMKRLFDSDSQRFNKYSLLLIAPDNTPFLIDYSKNLIDEETFRLLINLAKAREIEKAIDGMYTGVHLNCTESRPVLFVYLRYLIKQSVELDGEDIMKLIANNLDHMCEFSDAVINGDYKGYTGKAIKDIVWVGDGNSDIGTIMATEALKPYNKGLNIHCVFNRDTSILMEVLSEIDHETSLFIIRSRSFLTRETRMISDFLKEWFLKQGGTPNSISKHFVAITSNVTKATEFGINISNIFEEWDWVAPRFSLWCSNGLLICLSVGFNNFKEMIEGAFMMDCHFRSTPLDKNAPVILALLGVWYINFFGADKHCVLPYDIHLRLFPLYLTNLDMESNGKTITKNGTSAPYKTAPVLWSNSQLPFYEYLHQSKRVIPCDFIAPVQTHVTENENIDGPVRLCDVVGESEALMNGKSAERVKEELYLKGLKEEHILRLLPFRVFKGNKPSNTILFQKLTPSVLGMLLSLYEMKIFTQGIIWNINSFDSWGNELGRQYVKDIFDDLANDELITRHDQSTNSLINFIKKYRSK